MLSVLHWLLCPPTFGIVFWQSRCDFRLRLAEAGVFHDDVFEAAFEFEEANGVFSVVAGQGVWREALSGFLGVGF